MGYEALVNKYVTKAFVLVQDLAIDVVITKNTAEFDFGSNTTTTTAETTKALKAVILDINKESQDHNYEQKQMIFQSEDLDDLSAYDTVTIGTEVWEIGTRINNSGYVYLVDIYKTR